MNQPYLEHVNISVSDPDLTARTLCQLFDWTVRWSGASMDEGYTVHVGNQSSYIALYTNAKIHTADHSNHTHLRNLNHIAVVVNDLAEVQNKALELALTPFNFGEYEPGNRFYVRDNDGLEIEVVSYT